jgi:hypothetical protein
MAHAETWLEAACPRLRSTAALACLYEGAAEFKPRAGEILATLLRSPRPDDRLAALGALARMPHADLLPLIRPMLHAEHARERALALDIWSRCPHAEAEEALEMIDDAQASPSHLVRAAAIRAAACLPFHDMPGLGWLSHALRDTDYRVREAGRSCAKRFMPQHRIAWAETLIQHGTDFELQAVMIEQLAATDITSKIRILKKLSTWHVGHARNKLLIREHLGGWGTRGSPELLLLMQVLREEAKRHLETVLHILGCLDRGRQMSCIRAGLASGNRHVWAQAMETALQHKQEGDLFRELAILYEAEREGVDLGGCPPGGKQALTAWLAWCQEYGSEWLAECARYCGGNKGIAS